MTVQRVERPPSSAASGGGPQRLTTLTVVVLTYNEMQHIERCLRSAERIADELLVVDSYSSDGTADRAALLGARVIQHEWVNYSTQMNWALEHGEIRTEWVMRLDADEILDEALVSALKDTLAAAEPDLGAFEVNRRIIFLGQEIRHGGMAPMFVTRVWRAGWARCESRWMDEHMVVTRGRVARMRGSIVDHNLNSLTWWTEKHNLYANREALDLLEQRYGRGPAEALVSGLNRQARIKRRLKTNVYSRLPLGIRAWCYYAYRLVVRRGILDGWRGITYHTLQGLWYRLLVDAKVFEVESMMKGESYEDMRDAARRILGADPGRRESTARGET